LQMRLETVQITSSDRFYAEGVTPHAGLQAAWCSINLRR
jgi:hypothetical protein